MFDLAEYLGGEGRVVASGVQFSDGTIKPEILVGVPAHLDPQFPVEHEERLVITQMSMHRTAVAPLTLLLQDIQASAGGLPAGADANQRA